MARTIITRTGSALVSIAEAKEHIRINGTDDDAYLSTLITAATSWAEQETDCILIASTVIDYLPCWPWQFYLQKQPVTAITSVEYQTDEGWQAFTDYKSYIYQHGHSALLMKSRPDLDTTVSDVFRVTYTCMLQRDIEVARQLVMMIASQMYTHRELEVTGTIVAKVAGYEHLVRCLKPGGAI